MKEQIIQLIRIKIAYYRGANRPEIVEALKDLLFDVEGVSNDDE